MLEMSVFVPEMHFGTQPVYSEHLFFTSNLFIFLSAEGNVTS